MANNESKNKIIDYILCGVIGAFFAILSIVWFIYINIDQSFISNTSCQESKDYIYCFFDKDWDSETYLAAITDFYSAIITVLIALLGAVAGFAFVSVRSSARHWADEKVESEVKEYFQGQGKNLVEEIIRKEIMDPAIQNELSRIQNRLDELVSMLEEEGFPVEKILDSKDEKEAD